jgi:carboxyl-terminal processing protease
MRIKMSPTPFRRPVLLVLVVAAFLAGVCFPGADELWARTQGLPEAVSPAPASATEALDAWNVYNRVLQELDRRYYGELPTPMKLTYSATRGMLRTLDDPFTRFMDPTEYRRQKDEAEGAFVGIGIYLDEETSPRGYMRVVRVILGGPAAKAGLKAGDRVTHVDGKNVKGLKIENVSKMIRGREGTAVRLNFLRPPALKSHTYRIVRRQVEYPVVEHEMKPDKIGYVKISMFSGHADAQVEQAVRQLEKQGMHGLVIDLRGNPGGTLESAVHIVSRFLPPDNTAVVIVEAGGRRIAAPCDPKKYLKLKKPITVLIDGESASASEILAGAIKDTGTGTVIGETTFGKGLVQSVVELPGGAAAAITSAKYLTSKGNDINRTRERRGGVEPDIVVHTTDKDRFLGKDPQLERAIEVLRQKSAADARTE